MRFTTCGQFPFALFVGAVLVAAAGCGGGGGGSSTPPPTPVVIQPSVKVLPSDGSVTVNNVTGTGLNVTGGPSIKAGDVIVSSLDGGLMRKVTSVAGTGTVNVQTTQATFPDVFASGAVDLDKALAPSDYGGVTAETTGVTIGTGIAPTVRPASTVPPPVVELINFNHVKIMSGNTPFVELNGVLAVNVAMSTHVKLNSQGLVSAQLVSTITTVGNVAVTVDSAGTFPDSDITLGVMAGKPITVMVGTVPVVITPSINLTANASGQFDAATKLSISGTTTSVAGSQYTRGGGWKSTPQTLTQSTTITPSVSPTATGKFQVTPLQTQVEFIVSGAVVGSVNEQCINYQGTLTHQASPAGTIVEVDGNFNGNVAVSGTPFKTTDFGSTFDKTVVLTNTSVVPTFTLTPPVAVLGEAAGAPGGIFPVGGAAPVGLTASNYVPVAIRVTGGLTADSDRAELVEYHVYRPDFIAKNPPSGFAPAPIWAIATNSDLTFYDDGSVKSYIASKPLSSNTTQLVTFNNATSPDPGTAIGVDLVGTRYAYSVEALYQTVDEIYHLTPTLTTNYITYLQPVFFASSDFNTSNPSSVQLTIPSTLGADDYVMEASTSPSFTTAVTYKPYNPALIQVNSATQANPRVGATFAFFNPAGGWNMAADFPGGGPVFARIGVRDSRNGTDTSTNPYLFTETEMVPSG